MMPGGHHSTLPTCVCNKCLCAVHIGNLHFSFFCLLSSSSFPDPFNPFPTFLPSSHPSTPPSLLPFSHSTSLQLLFSPTPPHLDPLPVLLPEARHCLVSFKLEWIAQRSSADIPHSSPTTATLTSTLFSWPIRPNSSVLLYCLAYIPLLCLTS